MGERLPHEDFDFYIDILSTVAKTVGEEHTLQMKGSGAFWNLLGSMAEIQLPCFVLLNVLQRAFGPVPVDASPTGNALPGQPDLLDRLKKATYAAHDMHACCNTCYLHAKMHACMLGC